MVRIPRSEESVGLRIANQPTMSPDALTGPGRALQGLGKAIAGLGDAFQDQGPSDGDVYSTQMASLKADQQVALYAQQRIASMPGDADVDAWRHETMSGVNEILNTHRASVTHPKLQQRYDLNAERVRGQWDLKTHGVASDITIQRRVEGDAATFTAEILRTAADDPNFAKILDTIDAQIARIPGASQAQRAWIRNQAAAAAYEKFSQKASEDPIAALEAARAIIDTWGKELEAPPAVPGGQPGQVGPQSSGGVGLKEYLHGRLAPGYEQRTGDVNGLHAVTQDRLGAFLKAAEDAGHDIRIVSGHRSVERQRVLWDRAVEKYGSEAAARKWVAPPGGSSHQSGEAVDLQFQDRGAGLGGKKTAAVQWAHDNARKFGLNFPLGHEDWHIEPIEARRGGKRYGGQYDLSKTYWTGSSASSHGGGADVLAGKSGEAVAAVNAVAANIGADPNAIGAVFSVESGENWDKTTRTGSYRGVSQIGPDTLNEMGVSVAAYERMSQAEQAAFYGKWLDHYKFAEKMQAAGIDLKSQPPARQAAILQAMQFAPNGDWINRLGRGDTSTPVTDTKQARALGSTSIDDMEGYFKRQGLSSQVASAEAKPTGDSASPQAQLPPENSDAYKQLWLKHGGNVEAMRAEVGGQQDAQPASATGDKIKVTLTGTPEERAAKLRRLVAEGYRDIVHRPAAKGDGDEIIARKSDKAIWQRGWRGKNDKGETPNELDNPKFAGPSWASGVIAELRDGKAQTASPDQSGVKVADASGRIPGSAIAERIKDGMGPDRTENTIPEQQVAQSGDATGSTMGPTEWNKAQAEATAAAKPGTVPGPAVAGGPQRQWVRPSIRTEIVERLVKEMPNLEKLAKKQMEAMEGALRVSRFLTREEAFNRYDDDARKLVNETFKMGDLHTRMLSGDGDAILRGVEVSKRLGYVPEVVQDSLLGMVKDRSPSKAQHRMAAYQAAGSILADYPDAFMGEDGKKLAEEARDFLAMADGMGAEQALLRVDEMKSPEWEKKKTVLGPLATEALKSINPISIMRNALDESMLPFNSPGADQMTALMVGEYQQRFRNNFIRVGDTESAKKLTLDEMRITYGVTKISGSPQIMRYPVEKRYPAIGPKGHEYISKDIEAAVREYFDDKAGIIEVGAANEREGGSEIKRDQIFLHGDHITTLDIDAGRSPTYQIWYRDKNGTLQMIPDRIMRWSMQPKDIRAHQSKYRSEQMKNRSDVLGGVPAGELEAREKITVEADRLKQKESASPYAPSVLLREGAKRFKDYLSGTGDMPDVQGVSP